MRGLVRLKQTDLGVFKIKSDMNFMFLAVIYKLFMNAC